MAVTLEASGTQSATLDTEHTLTTETGVEVFELVVDLAAMVNGDITILRIYEKCLTGGTERLAFQATYAHTQSTNIVHSVPVPSDISWKATLEQTDGTGRSYPWKVLSI
mgnify:FL=1